MLYAHAVYSYLQTTTETPRRLNMDVQYVQYSIYTLGNTPRFPIQEKPIGDHRKVPDSNGLNTPVSGLVKRMLHSVRSISS